MPIVATKLGPMFVQDSGPTYGPPILLWASLFNDHTMWQAQVQQLNAAGWKTLAIDPPGHGASPGPERTFSIDECAQCAIEVLDLVAVSQPIVMIGSSWGGMVAPRVALQAPNRVQGLVLFNTTAERPTFYTRANVTLLTWMLKVRALDDTVVRILIVSNFSKQSLRDVPDIGRAIGKNVRTWERTQMIDTVTSVLIDRDATLEVLYTIAVPVLLVTGSEDKILPTPMSQRIANRLGDATCVEVPEAAHLVPVEAPESSTKLILDFLRTKVK